ncbi:uncharacterized protein LOC116966335 isoform X1 [Amblyraja radiata]|uniref:uncharacterized protein LOC116966335 isoform X1 n=1 Tax=Amblyraja radiata TaxID=386614 RepID=UPI0014026C76|nr:uncharacterized protein LOC116966335 isoform X1 [Amblyraja radiata]XP_032868352.1 uncharacterized protein LOC116966335 isoform X1 [Amblyraja radiata]
MAAAHTLQAQLTLAAFFCLLLPGAYLEEEADNCQNVFSADNYLNLTNSLKLFNNCSQQAMQRLEAGKLSELYKLLQNAADSLRSLRVREACQHVNPKNCSFPIIPANGGLVCLTLNRTRYCKPMCNKGYDFQFLRRSRPYERCGEETGFKWTTQYIGGNRLANCQESALAVAANASHYFDKRCLDVAQDYSEETLMISAFLTELKKELHGKINNKTVCFLCGDTSFPISNSRLSVS